MHERKQSNGKRELVGQLDLFLSVVFIHAYAYVYVYYMLLLLLLLLQQSK